MPPTSDGWPSRCSGVRLPKSLGGACDFGCGAQELGVDRAGADGIDSDAVRSQRVGEGLWPSTPRRPCWWRSPGESGTSDAAHAGHQHDAAGPALGFHRLRGGLRVEQHSFQVYRDQSVEVGLGDIGTVLVCGDSGVCHHDVDPAELHQGGNARIEIPALDDIGAHELRRDAQRRSCGDRRAPALAGCFGDIGDQPALAPWRAAESDAARPGPLEALVTTTTLPAKMSLIATPKHAGVSSVWRRSL